ncbi:hypothetical protein EJ02DRAFT_257187 [Clathrospora elynae]|uniref:Uncharacterized protein n=1 Tax=Clathrospora elynae TaxID=706981 RepID=A0A6A5SHX3_9PLEO|nr:hypothetical protein EJ02DRAFT_257187 [Clathrospora elynae]
MLICKATFQCTLVARPTPGFAAQPAFLHADYSSGILSKLTIFHIQPIRGDESRVAESESTCGGPIRPALSQDPRSCIHGPFSGILAKDYCMSAYLRG